VARAEGSSGGEAAPHPQPSHKPGPEPERSVIDVESALLERVASRVERPSPPTVSDGGVSDGDLIEGVAARDRDAFEELYHRYARAVLGMALRRMRDRGRAEDAVQDAFAAVWRSARTYDRSRGPGGAWLYTVARNVIVDGLRRTPEATVPGPPELPSTEPGPPDEAEAAWNAWRIHRALESLPEHERPVIDLAYFSGLSQSEIASFLQIPLGTVKTRTRSALARLADELEGTL
jgi:RNA polymerase sigma-70 factor (ECF subfamily)